MQRRLPLIFFLASALVLAAAGCGGDDDSAAAGGPAGGPPGGEGGPPPSAVSVEPARSAQVQNKRSVNGSLRPKRRSLVANVEPGRVVAIEFDEAQDVKAGDVLVKIDDRRLREDLAQAQAQLAVAQASVLEQQAELERLRGDLRSRESASEQMAGAVSELDLRQARTQVEVGQAQLNAAEKDVAAAQTRIERINVQLADATVTAPFDGRIIERMAELGEYLSAGATIGELVSTDVFEAVVDVPESVDYAALSSAEPGDVTIVVDSLELRLTPESVRVVPSVDPQSRRYRMVADVTAGPDRPLASGMSVTAEVPTGDAAEQTIVPSAALLRDGAGFYVFSTSDGPMGTTVFPVGVSVAYRLGDDAVVEGGELRPGMPVVVEGGQRLRPGQPVAVEGAGPPPQREAEGGREDGDGTGAAADAGQ